MTSLQCRDCTYNTCSRGCMYFQNQLEIATKEIDRMSFVFIDNFGLIKEVNALKKELAEYKHYYGVIE